MIDRNSEQYKIALKNLARDLYFILSFYDEEMIIEAKRLANCQYDKEIEELSNNRGDI